MQSHRLQRDPFVHAGASTANSKLSQDIITEEDSAEINNSLAEEILGENIEVSEEDALELLTVEDLPYENAIAAAAPPVNNETVEEETIEQRAQRLFEEDNREFENNLNNSAELDEVAEQFDLDESLPHENPTEVTAEESNAEMTVRDIYYVKELEAHMMPGRNGTITVLVKKRHCSLCGQHSFRKNDWCPHLIKAGRSMNMKFDNITPR